MVTNDDDGRNVEECTVGMFARICGCGCCVVVEELVAVVMGVVDGCVVLVLLDDEGLIIACASVDNELYPPRFMDST